MKRFTFTAFVGFFFLLSNLFLIPVSSASDNNFIEIASGTDEVTVSQFSRRSLRGGRNTTRVTIPIPTTPEPAISATAVPVPASALLFSSALLGFSLVSRRK